MLMKFPKLIDAIRTVHPEPVDDVSFLNEIDRQNTLRVKLIACGFAWSLSTEQMQAKLKDHHQQPLYSRNLWEFILKYAFSNHMTYEAWQKLHQTVMDFTTRTHEMEWEDVLVHTVEGQLGQDEALFRSAITIPALKYYIDHNGGITPQQTPQFTEELERALMQTSKQRHAADAHAEILASVILENLQLFSVSRGRTRLYFLREVYFYMMWIVEELVALSEAGRTKEVLKEAGRYFSCRTELQKMQVCPTGEELRQVLMDKKITPKAIADDFASFFSGPFLMEPFEVLDAALNDGRFYYEEKKILVQRLSKNHSNLTWDESDDSEESLNRFLYQYVELQEESKHLKSTYRAERKNRGDDIHYDSVLAKSSVHERRYETCLRNMITGKMDISREWLLLFILFVEKKTRQNGRPLSIDHVSNLLQKCQFEVLDADRLFDQFFIESLKGTLDSKEAKDWLMEVMQMAFLTDSEFSLIETRKNEHTLQHDLSAMDPNQARQEAARIEQVAEAIKPNPWKRNQAAPQRSTGLIKQENTE